MPPEQKSERENGQYHYKSGIGMDCCQQNHFKTVADQWTGASASVSGYSPN